MRILIVEDEIIPATYLKKILLNKNHEVVAIAKRGKEAIELARVKKPDIIFMDIMLKDNISGADAGVEIHNSNPDIIIIFLTAFSDQEMIDFAVRSEAFAYLLKPYRENEILATLQLAIAKLSQKKDIPKDSDEVALVDNYIYNKKSKRVFLDNIEVELGPKALQLIQILCQHTNITLQIDDIMEQLWSEPKPKQTLRSLIHRIRQLTSSDLIQNVNKFGYKIGLK